MPILLSTDELVIKAWVQMVPDLQSRGAAAEQALELHGLSLCQFDVLATLQFAEGVRQQELAQRLLATKGKHPAR